MANISLDPIALYGAVLSTVLGVVDVVGRYIKWRSNRRERRKVYVSAHLQTVHNKRDGQIFHLIPLLVCNLGKEAVIIKEVAFSGQNHKGSPGWFREPGACYGLREQVLPKELKPGDSVELPLLTVGIFRSQIDEIYVIDSDDRRHKLSNFDRIRTQALEIIEQSSQTPVIALPRADVKAAPIPASPL